MEEEGATYRKAGVDIEAGERAVELMRKSVQSTFRPEVIGGLGGFGGLFSMPTGYEEPVLVSGSDGVGTKVLIAQALDKHDTVGIDLVAMCVNDILVQGAEPLFFLDYIATGKLEPEKVASLVSGIADGCRQAGCALIGGETAEMPGFYAPGAYDLAGFAVGVVEKSKLLDGSAVGEGDALIGLSSSGLHSNGYSLARYILQDYDIDLTIDFENRTIGEELLTPTKIYVKHVLPLVKRGLVKAMAHITGGGITNNLPRVLPDGLGAEVDFVWPVPGIYDYFYELANIETHEMLSTFNMGIGMVLVVDKEHADDLVKELGALGEPAYHIGRIVKGEKKVEYVFK